jgi:hypothetical protein
MTDKLKPCPRCGGEKLEISFYTRGQSCLTEVACNSCDSYMVKQLLSYEHKEANREIITKKWNNIKTENQND